MTLCIVPKDNFLETYKYIVIRTLEIVAKNFPVLAEASEKRAKEIEEENDAFREKTLILLESLSYHYVKIIASKNPLKIEGITKKIFIPYKDYTTRQKGIKDAGKYLITIVPQDMNNEISKPSAEKIIFMERTIEKNPRHPHINVNKKPCWGEKRREFVKKLVEEGRFLEVLLSVPGFLTRINLESAFKSTVADFFLLKEADPKNIYEKGD